MALIKDENNVQIEFNPYRDITTIIDARDFELYCCEGMRAIAEKEKLQDFIVRHDYKPVPNDGKRQIDVWCEYTALGTKQIILGECKRTKRKIEIEVVEKLKARLDSIGAQRGYVFATAGFQSGAIKYAKEHRIVLVQVLDKSIKFITNSIDTPDKRVQAFKQEYFRRSPKYFLMQLNSGSSSIFEQIYPTEEMERKMRREIAESLQ